MISYIQEYINLVESKQIKTCKEQKQLIKYVKRIFKQEKLVVDEERTRKYFSYEKYFPFELFPWERFVFTLHNCVFDSEGQPRWPDLFILVGRGNGKNGYLAFEDFCLMTETNGIQDYNIDICANSEEQARTTFDDIYNILENSKHKNKLKKNFTWNKTEIRNKKTNSVLKFRTNNASSKDGLRSGKVDFDEIHAYKNWENINVFTTGFGKKPHPRKTMITTNGEIRGGPLDQIIEKAKAILDGTRDDNGLLPFICKLNRKSEVKKEENWEMPNPSIRYLPNLSREIKKEFADYIDDPVTHRSFIEKRMNLIEGNKDTEVTSWENILKTNQEVPNLSGKTCVCGIDYTKTTDFMSAFLLFKEGDKFYGIHHSWLCTACNDLERIKYPLNEAVEKGLLTMVDDVEINPEILATWIQQQNEIYHIEKIACDNYRYAIIKRALENVGYSAKEKTIKMIRPSDIMQVQQKISSWFIGNKIIWGDDSLMRWFTNNAKLVPAPNNNFKYGKIEPKSRKTDGFMAFVAAATIEEELPESNEFVWVEPLIF